MAKVLAQILPINLGVCRQDIEMPQPRHQLISKLIGELIEENMSRVCLALPSANLIVRTFLF